jgi:hypothetical protein
LYRLADNVFFIDLCNIATRLEAAARRDLHHSRCQNAMA